MSRKIIWALFLRWLYLLFWGMWRGEQAYTVRTPWGVEIATGKNFTDTTYVQTKCFYQGKP